MGESMPSPKEIIENINSYNSITTKQFLYTTAGAIGAAALGVATFFTAGLAIPIAAISVSAVTAIGNKAFTVGKSVTLSRKVETLSKDDALALVSITLSAITLGTSGAISEITKKTYNAVTY